MSDHKDSIKPQSCFATEITMSLANFRSILSAAALSVTLVATQATTASADSAVYEQLLDSSVWIVNAEDNSTGSGVVVDAERRLVVTNYHVVGKSPEVVVYFSAYNEQGELVTDRNEYRENAGALRQAGLAAKGKIVGTWAKRDLALVQLDRLPEDVQGVAFSESGITPGAAIHSIGNPGVAESLWIYSPGCVRQVYKKNWNFGDGQQVSAFVVQTTSPINPGDSGGPMVNDAGELVGIVSASSNNGRLVSYAIEIREIREMMNWYARHTAEANGPSLAASY